MTGGERHRADVRYRRTARPDRSPEDPNPTLERMLAECRAGRALDIATGSGRDARALAAAGWTVHAIDISRAVLERAQRRGLDDGLRIEWILADVDRYGFASGTYDLVTICNFDARHRVPAIIEALVPGGVLIYDHYLQPAGDPGGQRSRYRFESNELLQRCANLEVRYYLEFQRERDGERRVRFVGQRPIEDGDDGGTACLEYPLTPTLD